MTTTPQHIDQMTDVTTATSLTTDLRADLRELAERPADRTRPYLTVTLDYRPDGNRPSLRTGLHWLDAQEKVLREQYGPRGPEYDALTEGLAQLRSALEAMDDPQPHGVIAVLQPAADYALVLPLAVAVENRIAVGPTPDLFEIARVQDETEVFAVLLADSKQAFLHVFALGTRERDVTMREQGPHLEPGAKSTGLYEKTALNAVEQQIEDFAKGIAEETRRVLDESDTRRLVVMADDQMTSTLLDHFPLDVRGRVIGTAKADIRSTPESLMALALPLVHDVERAQEDDLCEQLETAALSADVYGVYGVEGTLAALQAGQVQTLILGDAFTAPAWVDDALGMVGIGEVPEMHPAGGDALDLRAADAREEFVRLALLTAESIEFVPLRDDAPVTESANAATGIEAGERGGAVARLRDHGMVGALLRYALAPDQAMPRVA